ncbi:MAG: CPBP family intramembrane metalloprotease [Stomatobaculum sp.]|nr:CPBP family intramembrane metalloprotease [Stomatobaculum sp.]
MTGGQLVCAGVLALPVLLYFYKAEGTAGRRPYDRSRETGLRVYLAATVLFFLYYMTVVTAINLSGLPGKDAAFQADWGTGAFTPLLLVLWAVVLSPVLEELAFRGLLLRRVENAAGTLPAVLLSSLLFGLYHGNLTQGIAAAAAGLLLGYAYVKTDSLLVTVVMHAAVNLASFLFLLPG